MSEKRIFDLIPESLKESLISEVQEILQERAGGQEQGQPLVDPVFAKDHKPNTGLVDPAITAFAKKKNEEAKNRR